MDIIIHSAHFCQSALNTTQELGGSKFGPLPLLFHVHTAFSKFSFSPSPQCYNFQFGVKLMPKMNSEILTNLLFDLHIVFSKNFIPLPEVKILNSSSKYNTKNTYSDLQTSTVGMWVPFMVFMKAHEVQQWKLFLRPKKHKKNVNSHVCYLRDREVGSGGISKEVGERVKGHLLSLLFLKLHGIEKMSKNLRCCL